MEWLRSLMQHHRPDGLESIARRGWNGPLCREEKKKKTGTRHLDRLVMTTRHKKVMDQTMRVIARRALVQMCAGPVHVCDSMDH